MQIIKVVDQQKSSGNVIKYQTENKKEENKDAMIDSDQEETKKNGSVGNQE